MAGVWRQRAAVSADGPRSHGRGTDRMTPHEPVTRSNTPTVSSLIAAGGWRPISNCPGRYLSSIVSAVTPQDLAGPDAEIRVFSVSRAPDPVHVAVLSDGGLISYARPDGRFVHTLNTQSGFDRKLKQLGIES